MNSAAGDTTDSDTTGNTTAIAVRTIAAAPRAVFAVLADPARHPATEPGDWVHEAIDPQPLTHEGQVFGMDMRMPQNGNPYVVDNLVIAIEPDRAIAWRPGQRDEHGELQFGGWTWRYDLEAAGGDGSGEATRVTLTYDWSEVPQPVRDHITPHWPPFPSDFLDHSLAALDRAVTTD